MQNSEKILVVLKVVPYMLVSRNIVLGVLIYHMHVNTSYTVSSDSPNLCKHIQGEENRTFPFPLYTTNSSASSSANSSSRTGTYMNSRNLGKIT